MGKKTVNVRKILILLSIITLGSCSQSQTLTLEQQIIEDAATALGGRDNIENVMLLTIEAGGILSNHGQDMTPESSTLFFAISDYKQVNNLSVKLRQIQNY